MARERSLWAFPLPRAPPTLSNHGFAFFLYTIYNRIFMQELSLCNFMSTSLDILLSK